MNSYEEGYQTGFNECRAIAIAAIRTLDGDDDQRMLLLDAIELIERLEFHSTTIPKLD